MIDKLRLGAEEAARRARASVQEAQLRHDLTAAYGELGRLAFTLLEDGALVDDRLGSGAAQIRALEAELARLAAAEP